MAENTENMSTTPVYAAIPWSRGSRSTQKEGIPRYYRQSTPMSGVFGIMYEKSVVGSKKIIIFATY
ncbi:MAG: hypothetical protein MJY79_07550 [Bacteroidaceae bacterium]|nr:hypothetical protein [Bacteroidaceae bacterium]